MKWSARLIVTLVMTGGLLLPAVAQSRGGAQPALDSPLRPCLFQFSSLGLAMSPCRQCFEFELARTPTTEILDLIFRPIAEDYWDVTGAQMIRVPTSDVVRRVSVHGSAITDSEEGVEISLNIATFSAHGGTPQAGNNALKIELPDGNAGEVVIVGVLVSANDPLGADAELEPVFERSEIRAVDCSVRPR
ncbi:hypothetical protein [Halochromatium sp.]